MAVLHPEGAELEDGVGDGERLAGVLLLPRVFSEGLLRPAQHAGPTAAHRVSQAARVKLGRLLVGGTALTEVQRPVVVPWVAHVTRPLRLLELARTRDRYELLAFGQFRLGQLSPLVIHQLGRQWNATLLGQVARAHLRLKEGSAKSD